MNWNAVCLKGRDAFPFVYKFFVTRLSAGFDMGVTIRCAILIGLSLPLLAGCRTTVKNDNPVFGAAPRRSSFEDAPNAKAVVDADDLRKDDDAEESAEEVQLASQAEVTDEEDQLFNATIVATANGAPIFAGEVLDRWGDYLRQVKTKVPPEEYRKFREEIIRRELKSHIQKHLLVERTKGELKPEQLKALNAQVEKMFDGEIEKLKKELKVSTRTELEQKLHERNTSINEIRTAFINQQIAAGYLGSRIEKPLPIDRKDLLAYYKTHHEDYEFPAKVNWRQIQISHAEAGGQANAEAKLREAVAELDRGVPFEKVAKKYSDGPTAEDGGNRDWMQEGSLADEELDHLLFTLPVNGKPREYASSQAFQIVQVTDRSDAGMTPFEEVQDEIHLKLQQSGSRNPKELVDELVNKIYSEAVIETKYDLDAPAAGF